jgi:hypothetical protein
MQLVYLVLNFLVVLNPDFGEEPGMQNAIDSMGDFMVGIGVSCIMLIEDTSRSHYVSTI